MRVCELQHAIPNDKINYISNSVAPTILQNHTGKALFRNIIFTALHVMQTQSSDENSVCPSVCPSGCQTQNRRKICLDFCTIRKIIYPSFLRIRIVGGGDPFYLKFWVNRPTLEEVADFRSIFDSSA